jgi:hypothetical protein
MDDDYEYVETTPSMTKRTECNYAEILFEHSSNNVLPIPTVSRSSDEENVIYSEVQGSGVYTNISQQCVNQSLDEERVMDSDFEGSDVYTNISPLFNSYCNLNSGTQASAVPKIQGFKIQKANGREIAGLCVTKQNIGKEKKRETVRDITTLPDGRMVVVLESGKIIVLNSEGKYLYFNEFDGEFENCTAVDNQEMVASCGFRVRFFTVHDTEIIEEEEKCIDFQYEETTIHGISHSEHKLLLSCNLQSVVSSQPPSLKLYDMGRKTTKTIPTFRFTYPGKVLLSSDSKSIYVADQVRNTVTSLSDGGKLLWETSDHNSPISFTLVDGTLAVAFEARTDIKCLSSVNGVILRSVIVEVTVPTKGFLLANNTKDLIVCPCDTSIDENSSNVFFVPVKNAKKQPILRKISSMKLFSKMFHK